LAIAREHRVLRDNERRHAAGHSHKLYLDLDPVTRWKVSFAVRVLNTAEKAEEVVVFLVARSLPGRKAQNEDQAVAGPYMP
jgi:hypothetical protein